MNETRITKVKRSDKSISIGYQRENQNGEMDKFTLTCHDAAHADFHDAFNALTKDFEKILQLSEKVCTPIYVSGVSYTWKEGIMGAVISGHKELTTSNSV